MIFLKSLLNILKDYCMNSSLAGLNYVADSRYHYTERYFWLACLLLSSFGSYYLIQETIVDFENNSVSMVVESIEPYESVIFPSIGICEMSNNHEYYEELEDIVNSLKENEDMDYNYDVEAFLIHAIFHNSYIFGTFESDCESSRDCDDCIKCPEKNYEKYSEIVRANCTNLISECKWYEQDFNCCQYFQKMKTSLGRCYLLNSIQAVEKHGHQWLNMQSGDYGPGSLTLKFDKAVSLFVINEEDIPHMLLTTLQFNFLHERSATSIILSLQNVVNDEGVHHLDPVFRKCVFPDEQSNSLYKYYSYSVCVTECLKQAQIKVCNCTHHNMIYDDKDRSPICGYYGLICLDEADLVFPQTTVMQPWRSNTLGCNCLPSCTEHEIKVVGQSTIPSNSRTVTLSLQYIPSQRYRRQDVKTKLDIVVAIGGIMGLFLGASILSGVELLYFFSVRLIGTAWIKKRNTVQHNRTRNVKQ